MFVVILKYGSTYFYWQGFANICCKGPGPLRETLQLTDYLILLLTIMSKKELQNKEYRFVVFSDEVANFSFLTKSTAKSNETVKWTDGNEYPLVKVQISSASHPFFTGEEKIIDTEGRVDRFMARAKKAEAMKEALANKAKKAEKEAEKKNAKEEA